MFNDDEPANRVQTVTVGDELYGVSVGELEARILALRAEIARTEAALTKKRNELSDAETLFR